MAPISQQQLPRGQKRGYGGACTVRLRGLSLLSNYRRVGRRKSCAAAAVLPVPPASGRMISADTGGFTIQKDRDSSKQAIRQATVDVDGLAHRNGRVLRLCVSRTTCHRSSRSTGDHHEQTAEEAGGLHGIFHGSLCAGVTQSVLFDRSILTAFFSAQTEQRERATDYHSHRLHGRHSDGSSFIESIQR